MQAPDSQQLPETPVPHARPASGRFIPLIVFLLLAALLWGAMKFGSDPNELPSVLIGKPVPAFALPDLDNSKLMVTEKDLPKQVFLINVWGTWCPSCKFEHPYLLKLASEGIPIIGINYRDDTQAARTLLERMGNPYLRNIVDEEGTLIMALGVYGAPETLSFRRMATSCIAWLV